jgi:hypothetical protein
MWRLLTYRLKKKKIYYGEDIDRIWKRRYYECHISIGGSCSAFYFLLSTFIVDEGYTFHLSSFPAKVYSEEAVGISG